MCLRNCKFGTGSHQPLCPVHHQYSWSIVLLIYVLYYKVDGTSVDRIEQTVFLNKGSLLHSQQKFRGQVRCNLNYRKVCEFGVDNIYAVMENLFGIKFKQYA